jgi:ornithine cyclodeaminase/alanine dehydrogenase-like protein (mu-crystallin family)
MNIVANPDATRQFAATVVVLSGSVGFLWAIINNHFESATACAAYSGVGLSLLARKPINPRV